ncbi:hypothetical protein ABK040_012217 [Willaertia magna]
MSHNNPINFSTLYSDLLLQIFCYLTPFEIPKLQLINKHWNFYCKDNILWKYFYHYYFIQFGLQNSQNLSQNLLQTLQEKNSIFSNSNFNTIDFSLLSTTNNNSYNNCNENDDNYWYNKFIYFIKFLPHYLPNESQEIFTKLLQENDGIVDLNDYYQYKYKNVYKFKIFNNNFNPYYNQFFEENNGLDNAIKLMKLSLLLSILMYEGNYNLNILQDALFVFCKYYIENDKNSKNNLNNNEEEEEDLMIERKVKRQMPILSFCKLLLDYNYKDIFQLICAESIQNERNLQNKNEIKTTPRNERGRFRGRGRGRGGRRSQRLVRRRQQIEEDNNNEENEEENVYFPEDYCKTIGIAPNVEFNDVFCYIDTALDNDESYAKVVDDDGMNSCYRVTFSDTVSDYDSSDWCPIYFNAKCLLDEYY